MQMYQPCCQASTHPQKLVAATATAADNNNDDDNADNAMLLMMMMIVVDDDAGGVRVPERVFLLWYCHGQAAPSLAYQLLRIHHHTTTTPACAPLFQR